MSKNERLILPNKRVLTDPREVAKFERIASTPNPYAIDTLYAGRFAADQFKMVTGIVAVYEEDDPEYGTIRGHVHRVPDVEVTKPSKTRPDAHYYFLVKPKIGKTILIRLTATNSLKVIQYSLDEFPANGSTFLKGNLEEQRDFMIRTYHNFLASYFQNHRE